VTEPRRTSTTKIVLIVVGSILTLCCIGGGVAAYVGFRTVSGAVGPPREATEAFIRDLQSGDVASAYGKLCASTRAAVTQEQFSGMISNRRPSAFEVVGTNVSNVNGKVSATVTANLTYPDGFTDRHVFQLRKEGDAWKVCGDPY
jgi:Domain of unknown function (DUF4878)